MKALTVQLGVIAQCLECRGYQGGNERRLVCGVGASVMRCPWYMHTKILSLKPSRISVVYTGGIHVKVIEHMFLSGIIGIFSMLKICW